MLQLTIEIPADLRKVIESHPDIDWENIAQRSLLEYAQRLARVEELLEKSEFTEEDAVEFDKRFKEGLAKHYRP